MVMIESEMWYTVNGQLMGSGYLWDAIAGIYRTKDDSFVRVHTNFLQCVCFHLDKRK